MYCGVDSTGGEVMGDGVWCGSGVVDSTEVGSYG